MGTNRVVGDSHKSKVLHAGDCLRTGLYGSANAADYLVVPRSWKGGTIFLPPQPADGDTFEIFDEFDRVKRHAVIIDGNGFRMTDGGKSHWKYKWGRHGGKSNYDSDNYDYDCDNDYDFESESCASCGKCDCSCGKGRKLHGHFHDAHSIRLTFTLNTGLTEQEQNEFWQEEHRGCDGSCPGIQKHCCKGRWFVSLGGERGKRGHDGATGTPGPTGSSGGPPGPQGVAGPQGNIGPGGPQGVQGIQGIQGDIGLPGPTGPTGSTGADGPPVGDSPTFTGTVTVDGALAVEGDAHITGKLTVDGVVDPTQVLLSGPDKKFGATDAGTVYLAPSTDINRGVEVRNATGTPIVSIDTMTGRVGIGTVAPNELLEVLGNTHITGNLTVDGTFPGNSFQNQSIGVVNIPNAVETPINTFSIFAPKTGTAIVWFSASTAKDGTADNSSPGVQFFVNIAAVHQYEYDEFYDASVRKTIGFLAVFAVTIGDPIIITCLCNVGTLGVNRAAIAVTVV